MTLVIADDDDLFHEEREELYRRLREGVAQTHAGQLVDGPAFMTKLRSRS